MIKDKVNFYFSMLIMLIAGVLAMWAIIYVATKPAPPQPSGTTTSNVGGTESDFNQLQQSLLK
jgi:hypothetical protein